MANARKGVRSKKRVATWAVAISAVAITGLLITAKVAYRYEYVEVFDARAWRVQDSFLVPVGDATAYNVRNVGKNGDDPQETEKELTFEKPAQDELKIRFRCPKGSYRSVRFELRGDIPWRSFPFLILGVNAKKQVPIPPFGVELTYGSNLIARFPSQTAKLLSEEAKQELVFPLSSQIGANTQISQILLTFAEGYGSPAQGELGITYIHLSEENQRFVKPLIGMLPVLAGKPLGVAADLAAVGAFVIAVLTLYYLRVTRIKEGNHNEDS